MNHIIEMEKQMSINVLGRCQKCGHYLSRCASISLDDSNLAPCDCPECHEKGSVIFEKMSVNHSVERKNRLKRNKTLLWVLGSFLLVSAALAGAVIYTEISLRKEYTSDEVSKAFKTSSSKSSAEILKLFNDAGIRESTIAQILGVSRFSIQRIMTHISLPTPSMEAAIAGLYSDYLLLGESKFLFNVRYLWKKKGIDQWYAFLNPLVEKESPS